ncbi:acetylcholine receptor subunit beta-type lev-1-like [Mytilus californianus]|uniref:acetylcholine receptor subunit beta-type lev-1-like n=1 Tax=Mytilus californianus TaxID=6549 RepID=UPI0022479D6C|nr:acetylcholine receptor subunit beta-type lev-1-like [Mytilus californianus]
MPTPSTETLNISIGVYIVSINYFREVEESISLTGCFILDWQDPRLTWNPSTYNNVSVLIIDMENIWVPNVVLLNRVDKIEPIGDGIKFFGGVTSTGQVQYAPGLVADVKCVTDISKFPFDSQTCTLHIVPWGTNLPYVIFKNLFNSSCKLDYYSVNSDWKLEECNIQIDNSKEYTELYVTLKIKRSSLYFATMVVFPTLLLGFLNPLVFILPVETGDRVGLSVTLLLSYAIFLTLASASVPATSNPMCTLLIIMVVIITISGVIVCGTTITIKYHYTESMDAIWSPLIKLTRWRLRRKLNLIEPMDPEKEFSITKKDVVDLLDFLFFYGSYIILLTVGIGYFIHVLI